MLGEPCVLRVAVLSNTSLPARYPSLSALPLQNVNEVHVLYRQKLHCTYSLNYRFLRENLQGLLTYIRYWDGGIIEKVLYWCPLLLGLTLIKSRFIIL